MSVYLGRTIVTEWLSAETPLPALSVRLEEDFLETERSAVSYFNYRRAFCDFPGSKLKLNNFLFI